MSRSTMLFPARMDAFPDVANYATDVSEAAAFDRTDALRLTLVLEELFTNTVVHGHGGDSEAPIAITCDVEPGRIAVTYEDTGPRFDPFAPSTTPDAPLEAGARPVGGLGLLLVANLARDVGYAYTGGKNRVSMVMLASGQGQG